MPARSWSSPAAPRPPIIRAAVAAVLRQHREGLGLSQEALGAKAALHRNYLGSAERGERNISIEALARWLSALGLSWVQFGAAVDARVKGSVDGADTPAS